jgi:hypothetical protein
MEICRTLRFDVETKVVAKSRRYEFGATQNNKVRGKNGGRL